MQTNLDWDEMEIILQLRQLREHGWGQLTVTVQRGKIETVEKKETTKMDQKKIIEEVKE